jgi:hypothetical protein
MSAWRAIVAGAWLLAGAVAQDEGPVRVAVVVPAGQELAFGEPFALEVRISGLIHHVGEAIQGFDVQCLAPAQLQLRERTIEPGAGTFTLPVTETLRYTARLFQSGEVTLPPPKVRMRGSDGKPREFTGEPVKLTLRSILPDPPGDIEWPGDVRDLPTASRWPWLLAALALVGLGVAGLLRRRALPVAVPVPAAAEPPLHEPVLAAIAALRIADGADAAAITAFYTAIAELVRGYAGRRFRVVAFVRTSPELLRSVTVGNAPLASCLQACDLVKFAAVRPAAPAHEAARAAATQFVNEAAP